MPQAAAATFHLIGCMAVDDRAGIEEYENEGLKKKDNNSSLSLVAPALLVRPITRPKYHQCHLQPAC